MQLSLSPMELPLGLMSLSLLCENPEGQIRTRITSNLLAAE